MSTNEYKIAELTNAKNIINLCETLFNLEKNSLLSMCNKPNFTSKIDSYLQRLDKIELQYVNKEALLNSINLINDFSLTR